MIMKELGSSIFMSSSGVTAVIDDTSFVNGWALDGSVTIAKGCDGCLTNYSLLPPTAITVTNSYFENNNGIVGGGGKHILFCMSCDMYDSTECERRWSRAICG
jgi:hypothetical protein